MTTRHRFLIPAFVCLTAADEPTAIAVACTLQEKTFRDSRPEAPRLYFDDGLVTVEIPAGRPFDSDPHSLLELDTLDLGTGHVALMDAMLGMRRDLEPLVTWLTRFVTTFGPLVDGDDPIGGADTVEWVCEQLASARAALAPFNAPESAVLPDLGTQGPAESAQDGLKVTDAVETELVRGGVPHITLQMPVPDQLCASILCTALEGGTGYWAVVDDIVRKPAAKPLYDGEFEYVSALFADTEAQGEDDEPAFPPQVVDYAVIRKGLQRILSGEVKVRRDLVQATQSGVVEEDGGHIDADAADVIVQAGMFGELVFG